jgi:fatty-acyl-CoA synthase
MESMTNEIAKIPGPTPLSSGIAENRGHFPTLCAALDYAATGQTGFNFHDARANLTRAYPYREMRADALAVAARLQGLGLEPGARVALLAETGPDFAAHFFGALYAAVLPVPLPMPTSFGGRESFIDQLRQQMASAEPSLVVGPEGLLALFAEAADGLCPALSWNEFARLAASDAPLPTPDPDAVAYLQYSSGSTRFPHGVAVTHRAVLANLRGQDSAIRMRKGDRVISWLPWYHDMGLVGCFLSPLAGQLSVDYLSTEDFARRPLSWLTLISRNPGTSISYSPSFGYDICARRVSSQTDVASKFDLSRWRVAGNGADMIRPDICQAFVDAFAAAGFQASAFTPSYGLAEATLAVTIVHEGQGIVCDLVDERRLSGAGGEDAAAPDPDRPVRYRAIVDCGPAIAEHRVEIRNDAGAVLPDREIGRVFVSGPSLMVGYFRDEEATRACLTADGWLDTGDMGYLIDGHLFIVGRAKDMIILNGRNHWPQDIEWAIEQLEGFKAGDIAAFAVTLPSGEEMPAVLVQCRTTDPAERDRLKQAIRQKVRQLTGMSCLVELVPPKTLPRTTSGKLSRSKARALYLSGEIVPLDRAA